MGIENDSTESGLVADSATVLATYFEFLKKEAPWKFQRLQKQHERTPEAVLAEAVVYEMFRFRCNVAIAENESTGGPDFRCLRDGKPFYVECTSIGSAAVTRATGLPNSWEESSGGFAQMTSQIKSIVSSKQDQLSNLDAPGLVAICSAHAKIGHVFSKLAIRSLMSGTEKIYIPVPLNEGAGAYSASEADDSLFFAFTSDRQGVKPMRRASSAVLLVETYDRQCQVRGLLHPDPARAFPIDLMPKVPFARISNWPLKENVVAVEWVIAEPDSCAFTYRPWE